ncbi:MAG: hypothetical protein EHM41_17820 [Chloroflexi bacterium]|nr:MAG: hypothetical protein EHM41_17820 [Chloroflexota bacterium]
MSISTNGLTEYQVKVISQSGKFMTERSFYLAGGTALTIYLSHRYSIDLDWFTKEPFADPMLLAQQLRDISIPFKTDQTAPGTLYGNIYGVRVSCLEYRYPLVQPLFNWSELGCMLASLDDLACMKLSAVTQRGSKKDFVDIYALGTQYKTLEEMLLLYKKKYSVDDILPVLYGLVYFEDAEVEKMPEMIWELEWDEIKSTITNWTKRIPKII